MNAPSLPHAAAEPDRDDPAQGPSDEPGLPDVGRRTRSPVSLKGLLAVALLLASLAAVSVYSIHRHFAAPVSPEDASSKRASDRPSAATTDPKRLDLTLATAPAPGTAASGLIRVPAIVPESDESDPIGLRRTPRASSSSPAQPLPTSPIDAPVMLLTSHGNPTRSATPGDTAAGDEVPANAARQRLDAYQRQLQGLLDNLTRSTGASTNPAGPVFAGTPLPTTLQPTAAAQPGTGLFGGQLPASPTPATAAALLGNRSLVLPKGTAFTCALKTRVVSATAGLIGCQVQRNVYSDDGRVLLIERGSQMDGEYRVTALRPGTVRIPVLWTRIRTPEGVVVDIESPGTGALGESGIDGAVDNRWSERIGAALLLSLIDDTVGLALRSQQDSGHADTVVLPSTTGNASKLAEKVLDSTINIPPLIYQNQGGIVGIQVARDVDFSGVYELKALPR